MIDKPKPDPSLLDHIRGAFREHVTVQEAIEYKHHLQNQAADLRVRLAQIEARIELMDQMIGSAGEKLQ